MTNTLNPVLTDWHKQIILGTVLGGSSLVEPKNGLSCYLFMRERDLDLLIFKANELDILGRVDKITEDGSSYRWHSACYPILSDIKESIYVGNKKIITNDLLDILQPIAIGVWFFDAGKVVKGCAVLNTHKLGKKGTELTSEFFNSVDIENKVIEEKEHYKIAFTPESTKEYFAIFEHLTPPCLMKYITI